MPPSTLARARIARRVVAWLDRRQWALVFAFLAIGAVEQAFSNTSSGIDFAVFTRAARRFLAGEPLYLASDGHYAFKYVPGAALLFAPLAKLPERLAWALWDVLSAAALTRVMFLAARFRRPAPGPASHLLVLLLIMPYYAHLFFLGQCDAVLLWAAAESEEAVERSPAASGLLLGLAVAFKLPFALLAALALARREWGRLGWTAVTLAVIATLPALRYGAAGDVALLGAWRSLLATSTPPLLCDYQNFSVFGVACTFAGAGSGRMALTLVLAAGALALVAASTVVTARRDPCLGREVGFAGTVWLVAFLSPLGWRTNLVNAIPLLYLAIAVARGATSSAWRTAAQAVLFVGVVLLQALPHLSRPAGTWLSVHRHHSLLACAVAAVALAGTAREALRGAAFARAPSWAGVAGGALDRDPRW